MKVHKFFFFFKNHANPSSGYWDSCGGPDRPTDNANTTVLPSVVLQAWLKASRNNLCVDPILGYVPIDNLNRKSNPIQALILKVLQDEEIHSTNGLNDSKLEKANVIPFFKGAICPK